jgi:hypothetical protein
VDQLRTLNLLGWLAEELESSADLRGSHRALCGEQAGQRADP